MTASLDASFLTGARSAKHFPPDEGAEVAFSGRSNSGKSSAINAITARARIARTSKTPGRTREINFFEIGPNRRLVDLPGYGYAKVAASVRDQWSATLEQYFRRRRSLRGLFVTVDIRRGLGELDHVMLALGAAAGVPAAVLLTKTDKLSRSAATVRLRDISAGLAGNVPLLLFSAPARQGVEEARERLVDWLDTGSAPGESGR